MSDPSSNGATQNGAAAASKATASSSDYGKTASFLAVGVGLTGVITYAYFLIASHTLSKPDYGQITVLWSAVFITISTLYRPIEQLLSRQISARLVKGQSVAEPMRVASTIQFGLSLLFAVLALALRGPIQNTLLEGNETLYWVFFTSVLFYAASYFARGFLAGNQRFGLFVALILSESCFRTIFAVLVAISVLSGQSAVAIGITAAPALSLLVVPFAFARRAKQEKRDSAGSADLPPGMPGREAEDMPVDGAPSSATLGSSAAEEGAEPFSFRSGGGFAAAVLLIMFSEQAFLNAGPLIIRGLQGAAEAGFIFNVLMLARAPLQLFQSISTSILPHLTSLHTSDDPDSDREFSHTVKMVLLGIVAFTALVVVVVLIAGPKCMQIAFGKNFTYDRLGLLLVTFGMGLYLSSVTLNQACIAQGQVRRAALRWITCAAIFIAWNFLPIVSNEQRRVEFGFLIAAGALFALLWWVYVNPKDGHPEDVPTPGSPEELETRLAIMDENV
jgi:O-antigen/teichoic acid export membrane protein